METSTQETENSLNDRQQNQNPKMTLTLNHRIKSETEDVTVPTDDAASDGQEKQTGGNEEVEANHQNITRRGRVVRKPNRFGYSL